MLIRRIRLWSLPLRRAGRSVLRGVSGRSRLVSQPASRPFLPASLTEGPLGCSPWWPEQLDDAAEPRPEPHPVTVERQWFSYPYSPAEAPFDSK